MSSIGAATAISLLAVGGTATAAGAALSPQARTRVHRLTTLNLSYTPYSNDSSLFLGMKKGFFAAEGIRVKPTPQANAVVGFSKLESGEAQLAFASITQVVDARAHGTKVKCLTSIDGNQGKNVAQDGTMLLANPKSGISSVADLKGKTVATVATASLLTLTVDEMVHATGVNPGSIRYVTMGFPEMPQALAQGTVQAAIVAAPFSREAASAGMKVLGHPDVVVMGGQSTVCFAATDGWIAHHLKLAHGFQAAMDHSIRYTKTHLRPAAATLVAAGLAKNVSQALSAKLGTDWDPRVRVASIAKTERLMKRFGLISPSQVPNPKSVVLPGT